MIIKPIRQICDPDFEAVKSIRVNGNNIVCDYNGKQYMVSVWGNIFDVNTPWEAYLYHMQQMIDKVYFDEAGKDTKVVVLEIHPMGNARANQTMVFGYDPAIETEDIRMFRDELHATGDWF